MKYSDHIINLFGYFNVILKFITCLMKSAVTKEYHALDCYFIKHIFCLSESITHINFKSPMCHRDNTVYSPYFPLLGRRAKWHFLAFHVTNLANGIKSHLNNRYISYRSLISASVTTDHILNCQRIYAAPWISERITWSRMPPPASTHPAEWNIWNEW